MSQLSILTIGVRLEGDQGVSRGATVLQYKDVDEFSAVILCVSQSSPHHPFIVWTYNYVNSYCSRGDYFNNLQEALHRYNEREY